MKPIICHLADDNKDESLEVALTADVGTKVEINRFFNKSLRQKDNHVFVAKIDQEIVGVIGWYQDKGSHIQKALKDIFPRGNKIYWVSYFAVKAGFRGKGIGTLLMKKLLAEMNRKEATELWTYSRRARVFYEKMGFVFVTREIVEGELHDFLKFPC